METRTDKIRRLQGLMAAEEAQKAILERRNLYNPGRQALLDNMKSQLEYERKMELREINRPVTIQPPKKNWQDNIGLYILVGVAIAVIAILISAFILNDSSFFGK